MKELEALSLWSTVLVNGTGLSPSDAVLLELKRYSGLPPGEVRSLMRRAPELTKQLWEAGDRSTTEGLQEFYDGVFHWVFGTLGYHARQAEGENVPLPVKAAALLDGRPTGSFLDFGAGVATASLLFSALGWRVTAADVSAPLLDFARWRAKERGGAFAVLDLRRAPLPDQAFDVICAFNTMVHVRDPAAALRDLRRALKPNGWLIFDVDTRRKSAEEPWHLYERQHAVIRAVRRAGFRRRPGHEQLHVYERQEAGALDRAAIGAYDYVRYRPLASWAGSQYRRARQLRVERTSSRLQDPIPPASGQAPSVEQADRPGS